MHSANPGHILYQVGINLTSQLEALQEHDPDLLIDLLEDLLSLVSPILKPEHFEAWTRLGSDLTDDSSDQEVFQVAMRRKRFILPILASHGLYARAPGKIGDASGLALGDEGEDEEGDEDGGAGPA